MEDVVAALDRVLQHRLIANVTLEETDRRVHAFVELSLRRPGAGHDANLSAELGQSRHEVGTHESKSTGDERHPAAIRGGERRLVARLHTHNRSERLVRRLGAEHPEHDSLELGACRIPAQRLDAL